VAISAYSMAHEIEYYLSEGFDFFIPKPFKFSEIYQVLELLCSVEFEYQPVSHQELNKTESLGDLDYSKITIPEILYAKLIASAQLNQITKIRQLLDELEMTPHGGAGLSAQFNQLLSQYNTEGIVAILKDIHHE